MALSEAEQSVFDQLAIKAAVPAAHEIVLGLKDILIELAKVGGRPSLIKHIENLDTSQVTAPTTPTVTE
jgi:hypothetical protein